ncbi:hypothetical protein [Mycobacterium sp.]|uniref:hypothetical protein n=1 Tax=Mycobacterium sp. TaxID=1785 RepID=UPI002BC21556|nr:hypothetical protein [Mycobacterium sp.]HTQ22066.1 hypothetical protein [Mycobacterium sp.]
MPTSAIAVAVAESPSLIGAVREPVGRLPPQSGPCSGIGQWPNIGELLAEKSADLIRRHGVLEWALAGGFLLPSGIPCLGSPSVIGYQVLREIIELGVGFLHRDEGGIWWATQALGQSSTDHGSWLGLALGFPFHPAMLDSQPRRSLLRRLLTLQRRVVRRDRSLGAKPQSARARLATFCRQLVLLDVTVRLVPALFQAAQLEGCKAVQLDCEDLASAAWGSSRSSWPPTWCEMVFDSIALLGTVRTQLLELPQTGWCPTSRRFGAAVHEVRWLAARRLEVELDQIFLAFLERAGLFGLGDTSRERHSHFCGTPDTWS